MPNWCENDLKVVSRTKTELQKFMKAVRCNDDDTVFKIGNVIPIPVSLREASAGTDENLYECLYGTDSQFDNFRKLYKLENTTRTGAFEEYVEKNWSVVSEQSKALVGLDKLGKARKLAETYKHNIDTYGHLTWYTWCIANWGTKWDASNVVDGDIERSRSGKSYFVKYSFCTAWSPPLPALEAMSKLYTNFIFKLNYYECGCGFKGRFTVRGGTVTRNETFEYNGSRGG